MKIKYFVLMMLSWSLLNALTYTVKTDLSGNFTSVQQAINFAVSGDTVLVYPGIYYECINFEGKNLTVASLYLTTQEYNYVGSTILDGNQQASVVSFINGENENAKIIGFTIQHGIGSARPNLSFINRDGGGILCRGSHPCIEYCIVKDNYADDGGGAYLYNTPARLKGNVFKQNQSKRAGGGVSVTNNVIFDASEKNSIFNNKSTTGSDILFFSTVGGLNIVLDTVTVETPENFYWVPLEYIHIQADHFFMTETDADLFVSPEGSDENDGLTPETPLQTIYEAMYRIKSDEENPNTIHLAPGIYAPSSSNQIFPINCKKVFCLVGDLAENSILDAENKTGMIYAWRGVDKIHISNLTLKNHLFNCLFSIADAPITFKYDNGEIYLENLIIKNNISIFTSMIDIGGPDKLVIDNVRGFNNKGWDGIAVTSNLKNSEVNIKNCKIFNNKNSNLDNEIRGIKPLNLLGSNSDFINKFTIINCEFSNNRSNGNMSPNPTGISLSSRCTADIINCTFADNIIYGNALSGSIGIEESQANIQNCIFYNNNGYAIYVSNSENPDLPVTIKNNLFTPNQYGWQGHDMYVYSESTPVIWENNLEGNPLFLNNGDFPYQLSAQSPCINAGLNQLPDGIAFPQMDLAGNPRLISNQIDMGAYEFQDSTATTDQTEVIKPDINVFPNPFVIRSAKSTGNMQILYTNKEKSELQISIYNVKGQKIKTVYNGICAKGKSNFLWSGLNDNGLQVGSGIYMIKISQKDRSLIKKITVIR